MALIHTELDRETEEIVADVLGVEVSHCARMCLRDGWMMVTASQPAGWLAWWVDGWMDGWLSGWLQFRLVGVWMDGWVA